MMSMTLIPMTLMVPMYKTGNMCVFCINALVVRINNQCSLRLHFVYSHININVVLNCQYSALDLHHLPHLFRTLIEISTAFLSMLQNYKSRIIRSLGWPTSTSEGWESDKESVESYISSLTSLIFIWYSCCVWSAPAYKSQTLVLFVRQNIRLSI